MDATETPEALRQRIAELENEVARLQDEPTPLMIVNVCEMIARAIRRHDISLGVYAEPSGTAWVFEPQNEDAKGTVNFAAWLHADDHAAGGKGAL